MHDITTTDLIIWGAALLVIGIFTGVMISRPARIRAQHEDGGQ